MISLTYPAGELITESVSTDGDVTTQISPGARVTYQLLYGNMKIVCDGNAANRYLLLEITDGTNKILAPMVQSPVITAGQTKDLNIMTNWVSSYGAPTAPDYMVSVGSWILLSGDDQMTVKVAGGQAGDAITAYFRFRKFGL